MPHIYYELYYHIVWTTKGREELVDKHIEKLLKEKISEKIKKLEGRQLEFCAYLNHCHLLAIIPPNRMNISDFVGQLKGCSSYEINEIKGEKYLVWQQGYGVLSLSKRGVPFVKKYIQNQAEHHRNNNVINSLEFVPASFAPGINPQG